jgi:hypothetical protein
MPSAFAFKKGFKSCATTMLPRDSQPMLPINMMRPG